MNQRFLISRLVIASFVLSCLLPSAQLGSRATACDPWGHAAPVDTKPGAKGKSGKTSSGKKSTKRKKKASKKNASKKKEHIRWGQRPNESDEEYDKRYGKLLKRIKRDKPGDFSDGTFQNEKGEVLMWTYMGHPFIIRTDISKEFTADTVMYIEMLHREYGAVYKILLGTPAKVIEKIEVIVYADRSTYMKMGGSPGSGGQFNPFVLMRQDRGPHWPVKHYRLEQFTDGITDFSKWDKGTLKHEAAHMELQLRLGYTMWANAIGVPVDCPTWWNEGHATVLEYWDFDKSAEENLAEIPDRGRYAPFIRRLYGTDGWKDFSYVWKIDPQSWHRDMTSRQGYLNYCEAWSLVGYMMHEGKKGRKHFRDIFNLSTRVGADSQQTYKGDRKRSWDAVFPPELQAEIEKGWQEWVQKYVARDKIVPDEEFYLRAQLIDPEITDRLSPIQDGQQEENKKWIEKQREKHKEDRVYR